MGGSAASSVAAAVAANALLPRPLSKDQLLRYALLGESAASGSMHADNVAPCLYGGLTLAPCEEGGEVVRLPYPRDLVCVLVHPHLELATRDMRRILKPTVKLRDHVRQQSRLAGFLSGLYDKSWDRIGASLEDVLIEPQRAPKIRGFAAAKRAALAAGAAGFSISGSGPSVFAWVRGKARAAKVLRATRAAFSAAGLDSEGWTSPVSAAGARVL
jgi:homoserine kinase